MPNTVMHCLNLSRIRERQIRKPGTWVIKGSALEDRPHSVGMRKHGQTVNFFRPTEQQLGAQISWEPSAKHPHKSHVCSCVTKIAPHMARLSRPRGTWQDHEVCKDTRDPCPGFPWCQAVHNCLLRGHPHPHPIPWGAQKQALITGDRLTDGLILVERDRNALCREPFF